MLTLKQMLRVERYKAQYGSGRDISAGIEVARSSRPLSTATICGVLFRFYPSGDGDTYAIGEVTSERRFFRIELQPQGPGWWCCASTDDKGPSVAIGKSRHYAVKTALRRAGGAS